MSQLQSIIDCAASPYDLRKTLEALGWENTILMHSVKNKPYWGDFIDPKDGSLKTGYEINPDAKEYDWFEHTEEELNEAVERMYYDIRD